MGRGALGMHTKSVRYLKTMQTAKVRFNLDGSEADAVSDEQRAFASQSLREYFKRLRSEERSAGFLRKRPRRPSANGSRN